MTTAQIKVRRPGKPAGASTKGKTVAPREETQPDESTYSGRVAARVRRARVKRGMTREQLQTALAAAGCELSMPAIYACENGQRGIKPDHYPAFAKALGFASVRAFLPAE